MKAFRLILAIAFCYSALAALHSEAVYADNRRAPNDDTYADGQSGQQDLPHNASGLGVVSVGFPTAERAANAFLKFDASYTGTLSSATLWLYNRSSSGGAHTIGLYQVLDDSWVEDSLTWSNQPALGAQLATAPAAAGWVSFDVTGYISSEYTGDGIASFALVIEPPYGFYANVFEDKENSGGTGNLPYLFLESVTAVTLSSFSATPGEDEILIEWETASEQNLHGFNLYRAETPDGIDTGTYVQLNDTLIDVEGGPMGAYYGFPDGEVAAGVRYYYWLEDVAVGGATDLHGPVDAALAGHKIYMPLVLRR